MDTNEENNENKNAKKPLHSGHRRRMMERFDSSGAQFQDHELLEVLLFYAIPRSNTNPIAHALIRSFGSLADVFKADVEELMLVDGVGRNTAEYINCLGLCFERINPAPQRVPAKFNPKGYCDFLESEYEGFTREVLEIFCLDKLNRLIFRKEFSSGSTNEVKAEPTEISKLLLLKKPYAIVAAHNHPQATFKPSMQDEIFTKQLYLLCRMHDVRLNDHIIVGKDGAYSFFFAGGLEQIKQDCKDMNIE